MKSYLCAKFGAFAKNLTIYPKISDFPLDFYSCKVSEQKSRDLNVAYGVIFSPGELFGI